MYAASHLVTFPCHSASIVTAGWLARTPLPHRIVCATYFAFHVAQHILWDMDVPQTPFKQKKKIYSFLICFSRRACMPKYFETPTASHWSMVWESKETRSLE